MTLLKDPDHGPERGRDREQVGQHCLQRQYHGAGEKEKNNVGDEQHRPDRDRRALQDVVDDVDVDSCGSGCLDLATRHTFPSHCRHDRARVVARVLLVGDHADERDVRAGAKREGLLQCARQLRRRPRVQALILLARQGRDDVHVHDAADMQDIGQGRKSSCQVVDCPDMVRGQRAAIRVVNHRLDGGLVLPGEIVHEDVVALARLVVRRQLVDVAVRESQLQERRPGDQEDRERRHQHHPGSPHHPHGHRMPCAGAGGLAPAEEWETQTIHPRSEQREQRRQERQAVNDCDSDHNRARRPHRGQERALEEQHRRQAHGHRDA